MSDLIVTFLLVFMLIVVVASWTVAREVGIEDQKKRDRE